MAEQIDGGRAWKKRVAMGQDSSGDSGPADSEDVTDSQVTGDPSAPAAEEPATEAQHPDAAMGVLAGAGAPHPFDDDERMAKLFERVRGPAEPAALAAPAVTSGTGTGTATGTGDDYGSGSAPGRYAARAPASPFPPPPTAWLPPPPPARRRRVWPVVTGTVVAVLLVGAGVAAYEL